MEFIIAIRSIMQCVYIGIQCAARRTRHRAFYFGGGRQVGKLNKQAKTNPKQLQKSDGRQVGERKKRPKIHPKTYKNHWK